MRSGRSGGASQTGDPHPLAGQQTGPARCRGQQDHPPTGPPVPPGEVRGDQFGAHHDPPRLWPLPAVSRSGYRLRIGT
ncbi:MAG TPA: hypothetical protein VHH34_00575 [Pseudonocardiaceae bacterium]|nr:hypothetical protein [Pseudonocardiaceae bacterium]